MTQLAEYFKEMSRQFGLSQVDVSRKAGAGLRDVRELEQSVTRQIRTLSKGNRTST